LKIQEKSLGIACRNLLSTILKGIDMSLTGLDAKKEALYTQ
jgi:hypothetical protein